MSKIQHIFMVYLLIGACVKCRSNANANASSGPSFSYKIGEIRTIPSDKSATSIPVGVSLISGRQYVKGQQVYALGERIVGDELINEQSDKESFPSAQDVEITLAYPNSGQKVWKITHVNILVDQSSSIGKGYVIDGGIQEKYIAIRVEANHTLHFSYLASFYGY